jgi:hypothetical protein
MLPGINQIHFLHCDLPSPGMAEAMGRLIEPWVDEQSHDVS